MSNSKAFREALEVFSSNQRKSKSYLCDKRLTQTEKRILSGFFLLRANGFSEVIHDLENVAISDKPFVEHSRKFLLGLAYNNLSDFNKSLPLIEASYKFFHEQAFTYFEFVAGLNLFIIHLNLKNEVEMKKYLDKIKKFPTNNPSDQLRILRCVFNYHRFKSHFDEALHVLEEIELISQHLLENDQVAIWLDRFNLYIKMKNFDLCYHCLEQMKNYKNYNMSANYNFIKKLLDNLTQDTPIYIQENQFAEHSILKNQILIIKNLEEGNTELAISHWKELQTIWPDYYNHNFNYQGEPCLFSFCLDKYRGHFHTTKSHEISSNKQEISERILDILTQAQSPINKEELFKLVYQKSAESKEDLQNLAKNIYKLKIKKHLEIQYKKGCYFIVK